MYAFPGILKDFNTSEIITRNYHTWHKWVKFYLGLCEKNNHRDKPHKTNM